MSEETVVEVGEARKREEDIPTKVINLEEVFERGQESTELGDFDSGGTQVKSMGAIHSDVE